MHRQWTFQWAIQRFSRSQHKPWFHVTKALTQHEKNLNFTFNSWRLERQAWGSISLSAIWRWHAWWTHDRATRNCLCLPSLNLKWLLIVRTMAVFASKTVSSSKNGFEFLREHFNWKSIQNVRHLTIMNQRSTATLSSSSSTSSCG